MTRLNQHRLRAARLARNLPVRQLARDSGIEINTLNRLETSDDPSLSSLSLAAFIRLADHLGVAPGTLLEATEPQAPAHTQANDASAGPQAAADARLLGALLNTLGGDASTVALTDSLVWDKPRLHRAMKTLTDHLSSAGLQLHHRSGLVSIRPIDTTHEPAARAFSQHPRARKKQRLMTPARSRLIYRAARHPISPHSLTASDRTNIAVLIRAGILIENAQRHYIPAPDVTGSLHPPPITPPSTAPMLSDRSHPR